MPKAPGTFGTLGAVPLALWMNTWAAPVRWGGFFLLVAAGVWAATRTERLLKTRDPSAVVIDEVVGFLATVLPVTGIGWSGILIGFFLFRAFDIWKPYPVRQLERLPAGAGIVADDLAAGVYAALGVWLWQLGFG